MPVIGTRRAEEARALDSYAGTHWLELDGGPAKIPVEIFWDDADIPPHGGVPRNYDSEGKPVQPGWYWWVCYPGCLPEGDGDPSGPFGSSAAAHTDAEESV